MVFLDLVMDRIYKNKWINLVQWTVLPYGDFWCDLLDNFAYQTVRYFNIIQIFYLLRNIPPAHSVGVKCENFFFHTVCISVIFFDGLGFIFTVSVTRNFDTNLPKLSFYGLFRVPVSVVFLHTFLGVI